MFLNATTFNGFIQLIVENRNDVLKMNNNY